MPEYFDVVNEKDEIIGRASREECHKNPKLIHRGAIVIIMNDEGKFLISKRSTNKDIEPGKWELLGEHNNLHESYLDAAKRGLKEEIGISGTPKKLFKMKFTSSLETEFDEIFLYTIDDEQEVMFDKDEISEIRFVSIDELKKIIDSSMFTDWGGKIVYEYLKYIEK